MAPSPTPQSTTEFTEEQHRAIGQLGLWMKGASVLLLLAALTLFGLGIAEFIRGNLGSGLLRLLEGGAAKVMGLILLNATDSVCFLSSTKGYDKSHLLAATRHLAVYLKVLIGFGCVLAVVLASVWLFS